MHINSCAARSFQLIENVRVLGVDVEYENKLDLLWLLGVIHTDGYLYRKEGNLKELRLNVGKPSLEMLEKYKNILDRITNKEHNQTKYQKHDNRYNKTYTNYLIREGSKKSLDILITYLNDNHLSLSSYPTDLSEIEFGAYFAGVIDGDGHIQLRKRKDCRGYARLIKITDCRDSKLFPVIQSHMEKFGKLRGYIVRYNNHSDLWIYISKDLNRWLFEVVYPHIGISRKLARGSYELRANLPG